MCSCASASVLYTISFAFHSLRDRVLGGSDPLFFHTSFFGVLCGPRRGSLFRFRNHYHSSRPSTNYHGNKLHFLSNLGFLRRPSTNYQKKIRVPFDRPVRSSTAAAPALSTTRTWSTKLSTTARLPRWWLRTRFSSSVRKIVLFLFVAPETIC